MSPDFNRFLTAIHHEEPDRLPNAEMWVDPPVKAAFLGETNESEFDFRKQNYNVKKDINFWYQAGYDYIRIGPRYEFPKSWLNRPDAQLTSLSDFEKYPWPTLSNIDYSSIEKSKDFLPEGMKVIASLQGGIFEEAWMIVGYENLMLSFSEQKEFVHKVFNMLGAKMLKMIEEMIQNEHIAGFWLSDDIAYTESLILSPEIIRNFLLPWYEKFATVVRRSGKVFLFHSDGNLFPLIDDFISIGFDAIHPIEPKAMDIVDLKIKVKNKLALLGSIDLDFPLSRGTPSDVQQYVKKRISEIAPGGGFAIGSSNSITHYVPMENYKMMLETVKKYGKYPIKISV